MEKQYEENQKELELLSESLTKMNCQMQIHLKVSFCQDQVQKVIVFFSQSGDPVQVSLVHGLHDTQQVEQ